MRKLKDSEIIELGHSMGQRALRSGWFILTHLGAQLDLMPRDPAALQAVGDRVYALVDIHFGDYLEQLFKKVWESFRGEETLIAETKVWLGVNEFNNQLIQAFKPDLGWHVANALTKIYNELRAKWARVTPGELPGVTPKCKYRYVNSGHERSCATCLSLHGSVFTGETIGPRFPWASAEEAPGGGCPAVIPAMVHPHCFTPDTEVFTISGWKPITKLSVGEEVWSISEMGKLVTDHIVAITALDYDDILLKIATRTLSFTATPDHKVPVFLGAKKRTYLKELSSLNGSSSLIRGAAWESNPKTETIELAGRTLPSDLFMEFLGWYLAEGSCCYNRNKWQISCAQSRGVKYQRIQFLAKELFGHTWQRTTHVPVKDDRIGEFFIGLGRGHLKRIPRQFLELDRDNLKCLFKGLVGGDGSTRTKGWHPEGNFQEEIKFTSSSEGLISDVTEIALKIGLRPSFNRVKAKPISNGVYTPNALTMSFGRCAATPFKNSYRTEIPYSGKVISCTTKEHHTLYVRQSGKTLFAGNCGCRLVLIT